jgi:hypothetical protein
MSLAPVHVPKCTDLNRTRRGLQEYTSIEMVEIKLSWRKTYHVATISPLQRASPHEHKINR